jgi:hypothetical protein
MGWIRFGLPLSLALLASCGGSTTSNGSGPNGTLESGAQYCGADTVWCGGHCVAVQVAAQACPGGSSSSGGSTANSGIVGSASGSSVATATASRASAGNSGGSAGSTSRGTGSTGTSGDQGGTSAWPPSGGSSSGSVDGGGSSAGSIEVSDAGTANLPYDVIAAVYSHAVDSMVIVTDTGNALHLVDPHTLIDVSIALPLTPTSVAVSPDGTHAAVGHNGFISYVDLNAQRVQNTWQVPAPFGAVALSNTYVYGVPSSDQWVSLYAVEASTGTVTASNQNFTWAGSQLAMSPDGQTLYLVEVGLEPESIYSYSLANPATPTQTAMYFGDQEPPCGIMWISKDGSRLYTGCGYVFNTNGLTYFGELTNTNEFVTGVDDWSSDGTVAALGASSVQSYGSTTGATQLQLYGPQFLTLNETLSLPEVSTPGGAAPSDGRYVFHDTAGTSTFAIVHATDPSSQVGVFAVARLQ